jgi:hypothetical protein
MRKGVAAMQCRRSWRWRIVGVGRAPELHAYQKAIAMVQIGHIKYRAIANV